MHTCLLLLAEAALLPLAGPAQPRPLAPVQAFPLAAVQLLDSPFYQAQQTDKAYLLALGPDRLLAPYLREAGLPPKARRYPNWEDTGLDGHIGGHYLSALMVAATGDAQVRQRLDYLVSELARCQRQGGDGYVGGVPGGRVMWAQVQAGHIAAGGFELNQKWAPLYNLHKTYAGLRDAYLYAGSAPARTVLIGLTDWMLNLTAGLSDQQVQQLLVSKHGFEGEQSQTGTFRNRHWRDAAHWFSYRLRNPRGAARTLRNGLKMEQIVAKHAAIMDKYDPEKRVDLLVDEWGVWTDVEPGTNPGFLYQQNTLRDALLAGTTLNIFNNHCDRVRGASLAQAVNVLQALVLTDKEKLLLTLTYHVFDLYQVHQDAQYLPLQFQSPDSTARKSRP